ncbi:hypothetical protein HDV03_002193 [Kappamyces sp. JEL0829]|nr:hypothetical protein HDV03_002193 [Kappamyces sp. JEL0829]KAJ3349728.1 hypothetical protein HDU91_006354 [Kappamyces sp. JEL0680]
MIRQLFEKYDADSNGSINAPELQRLCADMGYYLNNEEALVAVQLLDCNGDGTIGYEEFLQWWRTENRFQGLQLSLKDMQTIQMIRKDFARIDVHEFKHLHAELLKRNLTDRNLIDTLQAGAAGTNRRSWI